MACYPRPMVNRSQPYSMRFSTSLCKVLRAGLLYTTSDFASQRAVLHNTHETLPLLGVCVQAYCRQYSIFATFTTLNRQWTFGLKYCTNLEHTTTNTPQKSVGRERPNLLYLRPERRSFTRYLKSSGREMTVQYSCQGLWQALLVGHLLPCRGLVTTAQRLQCTSLCDDRK
jgi:hypothetical protein